jgi:hypothetical protein
MQVSCRRLGPNEIDHELIWLTVSLGSLGMAALRPDQEERINAIVERSAILDTSKFVRIAVDWLLRSDIGQVIKTIVDDEAFPDYAMPKKTTGRKKPSRRKRGE